MNPITRKSMSKLVMQPSFRAVGQTHRVEWQTFEKPENKRQMYGSQFTQSMVYYAQALLSYIYNISPVLFITKL